MSWVEIITTILTPGGIAVGIFQTGSLIQRVKTIEVRMDKFELRMDKFEARMDKFEARMIQFEKRLSKLAMQVKLTLRKK